MTNIFNALENCLQQIENGTDIESVLKQYPELANELRPILKTAIKSQQNQTAEPSAEAFQRGRAKVMQRATQLQKSPVVKQKSVIPVFSRLAISFALAFVFLLSGTGLLSASASTLPGDRLYTVKRGWENIRLFLIFDQEARKLLEDEFENERLYEVDELLTKGKNEQIQFVGIFMQVNGASYVSGVSVVLPTSITIPDNGAVISVSGFTNPQGWVDVATIELLPAGETVPLGSPVEVIDENDETESTTPSANEAMGTPQIIYYDIQGILQSISTTELVINNLRVYLINPQVVGQLCIGRMIKVKGYYETDGRFMVTEVIGLESCASNNDSNQNNNQNDNSDDNSNSNQGNSNDTDDNSNNDDDGNDD